MLLREQKNRDIVDFLRAAGIVLVIGFHVVGGLASLFDGTVLDGYIAAIPALMNVAWQALGSEIIFLLSGFLLSYLLLRELERNGRIDLRDFYVRRASRIVPLYVVGLLLYSFVTDFTALELLLNLLFVSKLFDAETIIPVGWSLEVLVQSYVVLPFLVLGFVRSGHPVALTLGAIVISLTARFVALSAEPASYQEPFYQFLETMEPTATQKALYYHLGYRATPFLLGFLLAWLVRSRSALLAGAFARREFCLTVLALSLLLIAASGFLPIQDRHSVLYSWAGDRFWLYFWVLQRFVFAIGICLLALCLWYGRLRPLGPVRWVASRRLWHLISERIYSIYLFHPVFLIPSAVIGLRATSAETVGPIHVLEVLFTILLATLLSTLFGGLVTRFVEVPARDWLRKSFRC